MMQNSLMSHCCSLSVGFEVEGRGGIAAELHRLVRERTSHLDGYNLRKGAGTEGSKTPLKGLRDGNSPAP